MYFESKPEPLSTKFLTERGTCCGNKCINCPYYPKYRKDNTKLKSQNDSINETPTSVRTIKSTT